MVVSETFEGMVERERARSCAALARLLEGVASRGARPGVVVSGCLMGNACRYDGKAKPDGAVALLVGALRRAGCTVQRVCPEAAGRLPQPRPPAERLPDGRIVDRTGTDVSAQFAAGTRATVLLARSKGAVLAVLKAKSPSCGPHEVHDGSFTGALVPGEGCCAAALRDEGLLVVDEVDVQRVLTDGRAVDALKAFLDEP